MTRGFGVEKRHNERQSVLVCVQPGRRGVFERFAASIPLIHRPIIGRRRRKECDRMVCPPYGLVSMFGNWLDRCVQTRAITIQRFYQCSCPCSRLNPVLSTISPYLGHTGFRMNHVNYHSTRHGIPTSRLDKAPLRSCND